MQTAWAASSASVAAGQVNVADAINNFWQITGCQVTVGAVATPFEFKSFADDLRDCQRYYQRETDHAIVMFPDQAGTPSSTRYAIVQFPVYLRVNTYTASGTTGRGAPTAYKKAISGVTFSRGVLNSSDGTDLASWIIDGEL